MSTFNTLTTREIVDPETGEIQVVETSKTFTTKVNSETFYMTFLEFAGPILGLNPSACRDLLVKMLDMAEYNTGKVSLSTAARKRLCEELKVTNNSITNYLKKLKDSKLISGEKGEFIINPQIFWKGELNARKQLLKDANIKITFSIE